MKIGIIVAIDLLGLLSYENTIPWYKPNDLRRFKQKTLGKHLIMGRKTFDSLPTHSSGTILPGRKLYVISKSSPETITQPNSSIIYKSYNSIESALYEINKFNLPENEAVWIIGGGEIYKQALEKDLVDFIDMTIINTITPNVKDKTKAIFFPQVPYYFIMKDVDDEVDEKDNELVYRVYTRWNRS